MSVFNLSLFSSFSLISFLLLLSFLVFFFSFFVLFCYHFFCIFLLIIFSFSSVNVNSANFNLLHRTITGICFLFCFASTIICFISFGIYYALVSGLSLDYFFLLLLLLLIVDRTTWSSRRSEDGSYDVRGRELDGTSRLYDTRKNSFVGTRKF